VTIIASLRREGLGMASVEAQCSVIGNTGFLGIPLTLALFGDQAIVPNMIVLTVDLIVFSSLFVILINIAKDGRIDRHTFQKVGVGLVKNPMIMSILAGIIWGGLALPIPTPMDSFLVTLGAAATPGALFAIGASLAGGQASRVEIAGWLGFAKLVLHPAAVAFFLIFVFDVDEMMTTMVVGLAALPVAGNVFMLASHYKIGPQRVSTAILFSTVASIVTIPITLSLMGG